MVPPKPRAWSWCAVASTMGSGRTYTKPMSNSCSVGCVAGSWLQGWVKPKFCGFTSRCSAPATRWRKWTALSICVVRSAARGSGTRALFSIIQSRSVGPSSRSIAMCMVCGISKTRSKFRVTCCCVASGPPITFKNCSIRAGDTPKRLFEIISISASRKGNFTRFRAYPVPSFSAGCALMARLVGVAWHTVPKPPCPSSAPLMK
mmetsp:Transcript_4495/g.7524  ORF Transcript_4495/g.7524 Transcript_4495/m.7524 type:complete len:204 (-) Transcript_4495:209-820(-)